MHVSCIAEEHQKLNHLFYIRYNLIRMFEHLINCLSNLQHYTVTSIFQCHCHYLHQCHCKIYIVNLYQYSQHFKRHPLQNCSTFFNNKRNPKKIVLKKIINSQEKEIVLKFSCVSINRRVL